MRSFLPSFLRKGARSYCLQILNGPEADALDQRAGWSIGAVRDRYIDPVRGWPNYNRAFFLVYLFQCTHYFAFILV